MAEETEIATETLDEATAEATEAEAVVAAIETESAPPPDPLAVATEARIRAEERARVLEEQLAVARAAKAEPTPAPKPYTAEDVEAAFQGGKISDAQRISYLADLQVQARLRERDAQARATQREVRLQTQYNTYLTQHPELRTAGPAADRVWAATAALAEDEGLDPQDKRTQLRAMERVFGPLTGGTVATSSETQRRRIPTGTGFGTQGPGGGGPGTGGAGKDPLRGIPAGYVDYWRKTGANLSDPKTATRYVERFWAGRAGRQLGRPA